MILFITTIVKTSNPTLHKLLGNRMNQILPNAKIGNVNADCNSFEHLIWESVRNYLHSEIENKNFGLCGFSFED
jgi:hypothetical protein